MTVLSLFDGLSGGRVALERAQIEVTRYYSSEIDKYAIQIADKNYPQDTGFRLGDMTKWRTWDIDWASIDLLTAGFPCQSWSTAGKQDGDNDPRGALVHELIAIWEHIRSLNPNLKFLFENVKMKKEFIEYINGLFGVQPILINSALVSAQNRNRYYWTNISEVSQPEDLGILLGDVLEDGFVDRDKGFCIDANYAKGGNPEQYFSKSRRQLVFDSEVLCGAFRGRYVVDGKRQDGKMLTAGLTTQRLEVRPDGKTNTITAVQKDNVVAYSNGYRKLTPIECERLQTLPDNQTEGVSNSQRYKMIGNGWTIDVISHIFKGLKQNEN